MGPLSAVRPATLLAVAVGALAILSGCGTPPSSEIPFGALTVYTSLPLNGQRGPEGRAVLRGEKIALEDVGATVGPYTVVLDAIDDSDPKVGTWTPEQSSENARQSSRNKTTVAYIGDLDSGATAVSLPINNELGVLQVSPLSDYTGLTQAADKGEPEHYYPAGTHTFARLVPTGAVEARALAGWLAQLHFRSVVIAEDGLEDGQGAVIDLAPALKARGIRLIKAYRVDPRPKHDLTGDVHSLVGLGGSALIYAGGDSLAAARLLRAVHAANPRLALFVTSSSTHGDLAGALGPAAGAVRGVSRSSACRTTARPGGSPSATAPPSPSTRRPRPATATRRCAPCSTRSAQRAWRRTVTAPA